MSYLRADAVFFISYLTILYLKFFRFPSARR